MDENPEAGKGTGVMGIGDWLIVFLISVIPVVNIIMILVWAFSGGVNANRRNYSQALIIFVFILGTIIFALIMAGFLIFGTISTAVAIETLGEAARRAYL